jgi:small subunit ribosomal protein S8
MINDVISDSLTRIRNASMRKLGNCSLVFSRTVEDVLKIFVAKGYIETYKVVEEENNIKKINVVLKYDENDKPVINEVTRISKPGRRVYKKAQDIKKFKNGYGTIIVSTNKGVISNEDAHKYQVGGEVLCSIW